MIPARSLYNNVYISRILRWVWYVHFRRAWYRVAKEATPPHTIGTLWYTPVTLPACWQNNSTVAYRATCLIRPDRSPVGPPDWLLQTGGYTAEVHCIECVDSIGARRAGCFSWLPYTVITIHGVKVIYTCIYNRILKSPFHSLHIKF